VTCSVTIGISRFERCSLCVQLLYYPFFGGVGVATGEEADAPVEEGTHGRLRKVAATEYGEPVVLRCGSYRLPLIEILLPYALSPVEFFRLWPSLPAIAEFTGGYVYEGEGKKSATNTLSGGYLEPAVLPILTGLKSLSSKPFHKVCSHVLRTVAGFQVSSLDGFQLFGYLQEMSLRSSNSNGCKPYCCFRSQYYFEQRKYHDPIPCQFSNASHPEVQTG
jgi:hypothetical protein